MGRTTKFDEDENRRNKQPKHAKNSRGQGMRIINRWSEETVFDNVYDDLEDSYDANTTFNTTQKGNKNGY